MRALKIIWHILTVAAILYMLACINAPRELVCVNGDEGVMVCRSMMAPPVSQPIEIPTSPPEPQVEIEVPHKPREQTT
jgi:hypothetical protein